MTPPAFSILAFADADTAQPVTENFLVSSPVPRILTASDAPLRARTTPRSRRVAGLIVSPAAKALSSTSRLTTLARTPKEPKAYPRSLGSFFSFSRTAGRMRWPARAFWPLVPRPAVLPRPPPRPTRLDPLLSVFLFSWCNCIKVYALRLFKASIAARALLRPFLLPEWILATMLVMPASSSTGRTDEPATRPRPRTGMSSTREAVYFADTRWAIELSLVRLTVIMFFLALRTALSIANVVSPALPSPTPTLPFLFPMMRATEKEKRRPPATVRDTRRMVIIFWSYSLLARGGRFEDRRPPGPPRWSRPPRPRGARAGAAGAGAATGSAVSSVETSKDGSETSGIAIFSCLSFIH